MKKTWKGIVPTKLNNTEQKLLADNYFLAYKIADSFRAPQIGDDIKENIAFNALQRAVKTYDKTREVKLSTYLHLCIMNDLRNEANRVKRLPYKISEVTDPLTQERVSIFNIVSKERVTENYDWEEFYSLVDKLKDRLNDRRKLILDMFINPDIHLENFIKEFKPRHIPKRLTYSVIAKVIGRSISKVAIEVKVIRHQASTLLRELGKDYG